MNRTHAQYLNAHTIMYRSEIFQDMLGNRKPGLASITLTVQLKFGAVRAIYTPALSTYTSRVCPGYIINKWGDKTANWQSLTPSGSTASWTPCSPRYGNNSTDRYNLLRHYARAPRGTCVAWLAREYSRFGVLINFDWWKSIGVYVLRGFCCFRMRGRWEMGDDWIV